jgi:hypothetical protein
VSRTNRHPPMQNLSPEDGSHPGHAALVEQGGHAALPDPGKICTSCAVALRSSNLASRTRQLAHFCRCANQVHPERGLRTQIGGLVQLSFQEVE